MKLEKSKVEEYVNFIADTISKGHVRRDAAFTEFCRVWPIGERTFYNYWKLGQERHQEQTKAQQKAINAQLIDVAKDAAKRQIMDRMDILEELSKIAKGRARQFKDTIVFPSDGDRVRAMGEIARLQNYYKDDDAEKTQPINITLNMDKFTLKNDTL